jgi:hypothetical protein
MSDSRRRNLDSAGNLVEPAAILVEGCHGKPLLEAPNPIGAGLVPTVDPSDPSFGGNIAFELLNREKGAAS